MNSVAADVFVSDIDRERFGFKTARVTGITADRLSDVLAFCLGCRSGYGKKRVSAHGHAGLLYP